tara:strand:+ start:248 stop:643 length:396 start_codon:yes stop_codon:yes gene_type:complete
MVVNTHKARFDVYTYKRLESSFEYQLNDDSLLPNLPTKIRIEQNQKKGNVLTPYLIRGKFTQWSKTILTGLLKTKNNLYTGDQYIKGNKSFLIFNVSPDRSVIQIMFFKNYMPFPKRRLQMVCDYEQYFNK